MKKLLALLLILTMCFVLAACSGGGQQDTEDPNLDPSVDNPTDEGEQQGFKIPEDIVVVEGSLYVFADKPEWNECSIVYNGHEVIYPGFVNAIEDKESTCQDYLDRWASSAMGEALRDNLINDLTADMEAHGLTGADSYALCTALVAGYESVEAAEADIPIITQIGEYVFAHPDDFGNMVD